MSTAFLFRAREDWTVIARCNVRAEFDPYLQDVRAELNLGPWRDRRLDEPLHGCRGHSPSRARIDRVIPVSGYSRPQDEAAR